MTWKRKCRQKEIKQRLKTLAQIKEFKKPYVTTGTETSDGKSDTSKDVQKPRIGDTQPAKGTTSERKTPAQQARNGRCRWRYSWN